MSAPRTPQLTPGQAARVERAQEVLEAVEADRSFDPGDIAANLGRLEGQMRELLHVIRELTGGAQ